jgi:hypothetical protein
MTISDFTTVTEDSSAGDKNERRTVPLEVSYDQNAQPEQIEYHHMTFGMVKLEVTGDVATLNPKWDRLGDKSLKEDYDRWVTTGDVLRSVEQLPFVNEIEVSA